MEKKRNNPVKLYLMQIEQLDKKINNMIAELERLQDMVTRVTQAWRDDVVSGGSASQDKLGDAVARLIDLKKAINDEIDRFVDTRNEICANLNKLTNTRYYDVLYKRYVLMKKWRVITDEMELEDDRSVYKIHGKALVTFGKVLKRW